MSRHGAHNKRVIGIRLTDAELSLLDAIAADIGGPRNAVVMLGVRMFEKWRQNHKKTKAS